MVLDILGEFENYVEGSAQLVSPQSMEIEDDLTGSPFPLDGDGYEIGTLEEGEVAEITFDVVVNECFVDYLRNDATITGSGVEKVVSAEVRLDTGPDLVLMQTDSSSSLISPNQSEYTLMYLNVGNSDAEDVVLTVTLPAGTRLNLITSDDGWSCEADVCTFEVGTLARMEAPQSTTLVLTQAEDADEQPIRVEISSEDGSDPSPGNNFVDLES